jgi:uncharacterized protein
VRVFLDANVLFSAAYLPESRTAAIFQLASAGFCELVSSAFAVEEARRNLSLKHPQRLEQLEQLVRNLTICPEPAPDQLAWAIAQGITEKDAPILAAASRSGAQLLVTGDKAHFGPYFDQTLGGVCILPPATALARILKAR